MHIMERNEPHNEDGEMEKSQGELVMGSNLHHAIVYNITHTQTEFKLTVKAFVCVCVCAALPSITNKLENCSTSNIWLKIKFS